MRILAHSSVPALMPFTRSGSIRRTERIFICTVNLLAIASVMLAYAQAVGALHRNIACFVIVYILDTTLLSLLPGSIAAIWGFAVRFIIPCSRLWVGISIESSGSV